MGRTVRMENHRVEVTPDKPWFRKGENEHQEMARACGDLMSEIKRHCDFEYISWAYDDVHSCEWCGAAWTEEPGDPHNGGCCDRDIETLYAVEWPWSARGRLYRMRGVA